MALVTNWGVFTKNALFHPFSSIFPLRFWRNGGIMYSVTVCAVRGSGQINPKPTKQFSNYKRRKTMARNSKRNAFTIVELVIVIAVIAILSTVLITTFTGVIESANVSADKQL